MSIDLDQARWENAPRFRDDDLATLNQETRAQELHQYFGQNWDEMRHLNRAQNASPSDPNHGSPALLLVSDLDDKEIRAGDKTVGEVEDVLVDLERRAASLLVDVDDDFVDADDDFVVGFNQISLSGSGRELALATQLSAADFQSAAKEKGNARIDSGRPYVWSEGAEGQTTRTTAPTVEAEAHPNSGLEATRSGANYAKNDAPNQTPMSGGSPAAVRSGDVQDRSATGPGERSIDRHADAVREALRNDSDVRTSARNVDVSTRGDSLVLSGRVSSEDERDRVVEAARRAATDQRIDDQLRVSGATE